jgi:hypothetical protein
VYKHVGFYFTLRFHIILTRTPGAAHGGQVFRPRFMEHISHHHSSLMSAQRIYRRVHHRSRSRSLYLIWFKHLYIKCNVLTGGHVNKPTECLLSFYHKKRKWVETRDFPLSYKSIKTFPHIRNEVMKNIDWLLYWFLLLHVQYLFRQDVDLNLNSMHILIDNHNINIRDVICIL